MTVMMEMMEMMDIDEEDEMMDFEESVVVSDYFVPSPDSGKREMEQPRADNTAKDLEILAKNREILALKERLSKYESPDRNNRRLSMENMQVIKMTPDVKLNKGSNANKDTNGDSDNDPANKSDLLDDEEDFFDFITRFQSNRMDDQRCSLSGGQPEPVRQQPPVASNDLMGDQRAPWNVLPGLNKSKQPEILQRLSVANTDKDSLPDDTFFEQLMKMQGTRIEDQRGSLGSGGSGQSFDDVGLGAGAGHLASNDLQAPVPAPTIPDEDFFSLICRLQGGRIDDQRASLPGAPRR